MVDDSGSSTSRRGSQIAGGIVLVFSLAINAILIREFTPLLPYYQLYWDIRSWTSTNLLGREHPDQTMIYEQVDFELHPSPRPTPKYSLDTVLQTDNPVMLSERIRSHARETLGITRIPRGPLRFRTHTSVPLDGYSLHKVSYQTQTHVRIPAFLLEPSNIPSPWPAILIIHGCGFGKAGPAGIIQDSHNALGIQLAQRGFLVLIPDRRGFGELQPFDHYVWPDCGGSALDGRQLLETDAHNSFNTDLRSLDVFDLLIAADYLATREDVTRVGLAGLSGGGVIASYVAGQSDTINAIALVNSHSYHKRVPETSGDEQRKFGTIPDDPLSRLQLYTLQRTPALSTLADNHALVSLVLLAPRPILIQYGNQDTVNYLQGGDEVIELIRDLYDLHGTPENVFVSVESGGHEFFPESIIDFFSAHLDRR